MSALRKKRLKSHSHSVTPSLDTPSGAGLGRHSHSMVSELRYTITCSVLGMGLGYVVAV